MPLRWVDTNWAVVARPQVALHGPAARLGARRRPPGSRLPRCRGPRWSSARNRTSQLGKSQE
eukprot:8054384-Alexandrium_andersonii.AAC.1